MNLSACDNDKPATGVQGRLPTAPLGSLVRFDSNDGEQYQGDLFPPATPSTLRRFRCEPCHDSGVTQTQEDNDHANSATVCRACKGKMRDTALEADTYADVFLVFHYTAPRGKDGRRDVEHAVKASDFYGKKLDPVRFDL